MIIPILWKRKLRPSYVGFWNLLKITKPEFQCRFI